MAQSMAKPAATPWKKDTGLSDSLRALEPDPLCGLRSVLGSRKQDVDPTDAT
jgi:hypothetical protein